MPQFRARTTDKEFAALTAFIMDLGFIEGKGTSRERPASADFCRAIVEARNNGSYAIAKNERTAIITIKIPD